MTTHRKTLALLSALLVLLLGGIGLNRLWHPAPRLGPSLQQIRTAPPSQWPLDTVSLVPHLRAGATPRAGTAGGCWQDYQWSSPRDPFVRLHDIARLPNGEIWAVGAYVQDQTVPTTQALIERWDGRTWQPLAIPLLPDSDLLHIAARAPNDVWVLGTAGSPPDMADVLLHWNGAAWSVFTTAVSYAGGLTVTAGGDLWAVGTSQTASPNIVDWLWTQRWTGQQWQRVPEISESENFQHGEGRLNAATALGANDIWAVGTTSLHWDGASWQVIPFAAADWPEPEYQSVAAVTAGDVWAVGSVYEQRLGSVDEQRTAIMHWTGTQWQSVPSPNPGAEENELSGVAAVNAQDVWAVGSYGASAATATGRQLLITHWDGQRWQIVNPPLLAPESGLLKVVASPSGEVWMLGRKNREDTSAGEDLVIHYTATSCSGSSSAFHLYSGSVHPGPSWSR